MRVNITANTCTIDNNVYLNSGEYNINKFYFTFSEEYLDEYVKKALFIDKDGTPIEMVIANNECDIPYDILKNPGTYTFGVYAYEMNDTELALRYSPEPTHFYVNKGSYVEDGISPTEPTPDEFAQYYQAMQDLITNAKPELIDYIEDNLPTVDIGGTSTLEPGSEATVINVGTDRNPVFVFGIPKGDPGTTDYNELENRPDLSVYALIRESANKIALDIDNETFKMKAKIFDKNNNLISESNIIDLPLESVVVSGEYDSQTQKLILTLENGNTIEVPLSGLVSGLVSEEELTNRLNTAIKIETISKNGTRLPIYNKNVDISVPSSTNELINNSGFITKDVANLTHYYDKVASDTRYPLVGESANNLTMDLDNTTYVLTATLKDRNSRAISVQRITFPFESIFTSISNLSSTKADVTDLTAETLARQNADTGLQNQIDAITSASDVVDVVSTYSDLSNYDTTKLTDKDVIKVMQDENHNNAISYYRWDESNEEFTYVGSEGPFYTKGETDTLLNDKVDNSTLDNYVQFTDVPTTTKSGAIKAGNYLQVAQNGVPYAGTLDYNSYNLVGNNTFIGKGSLENVITGKNLETANNKVTTIDENSTDTQYPSAKCVYDSQTSQDTEIDNLKMIYNILPTDDDTGETISIDNTGEMPIKNIQLGGNTSQVVIPAETGTNVNATSISISDVNTDKEHTIGIDGNTSQVVIPEEQGTSVSNTSIYVSDVNTDKEHTIGIDGNIYQDSTTGKNLFNINETPSIIQNNTYSTTNNKITFTNTAPTSNPFAGIEIPIKLKNNTQYTISFKVGKASSISTMERSIYIIKKQDTNNFATAPEFLCSGLSANATSENKTLTFTTTQEDYFIRIYAGTNTDSIASPNYYENIQIEESSTATTYEPYTYGASPNPSYPQNIEVVTGENDITIEGKNLWKFNGTTFSGWAVNNSNILKFFNSLKEGTYTLVLKAKITSLTNPQERYRWGIFSDNLSGNLELRSYVDDQVNVGDTINNTVTFTISSAQKGQFMHAYTYTLSNPSGVKAGDIELFETQLEKGSTATTYEPYVSQTYPINLGKNLFDKNDVITGKVYNIDGVLVNASWNTSNDYIPVDNGNYTGSAKVPSSIPTQLMLVEFDKNKTFIKRNLHTQTSATPSFTITLDNSTRYVKFAHRSDLNMYDIQLEKGSTPTSYSSYFTPIELCKIDTYQDRIYKNSGKWYLEKQIGKVAITTNNFITHYNNLHWIGFNKPNNSIMINNFSNVKLYIEKAYYAGDMTKIYSYNTALGATQIGVMCYEDDDATTLKQKLDGSLMFYPLAAPTITEITSSNYPTLYSQLNALYNSTLYSTTNINTETSNLLPYIDLQYNVVTPSPSPNRPSNIDIVTGENDITIEGKNLCPTQESAWEQGNINGEGDAESTTSLRTKGYIPMKNDTNYHISVQDTTNYCYRNIRFYDRELNQIGNLWSLDATIDGATDKTINIPSNSIANLAFARIVIRRQNSLSLTASEITTIKPQIELGTSSTTFEEYISQTYPVSLTSKNLWNYNATPTDGLTTHGITYTINNDGSITLNGTSTDQYIGLIYNIKLPAGTYYIGGCASGGSNSGYSIAVSWDNGSYITVNAHDALMVPFTLTEEKTVQFWAVRISRDVVTFNNTTFYPMLYTVNDNNYASYYPPIELCKIDTYKDRIYKNNDKWYLEKQIGKVVLNGSEDWSYESSETTPTNRTICRFNIPTATISTNYYCDKFLYNSTSSNRIVFVANNQRPYFSIDNRIVDINSDDTNNEKLAKIIEYVSSNNVFIYYVLNTPTTTEITDTTLVSQLNALYNSTLYSTTNINTETSNLLPYIDLQYNVVTPSPSPNRPSVVNVVKGENNLTICGKNLWDGINKLVTVNENGDKRYGFILSAPGKKVSVSSSTWTEGLNYKFLTNGVYGSGYGMISNTTLNVSDKVIFYEANSSQGLTIVDNLQIEISDTPTTYEPYKSQTYPINLPNGLELCKISTYQDYFYKDNGNWYKRNVIKKVVLDENTYLGYQNSCFTFTPGDIKQTDATTEILVMSDYYKGVTTNYRDGIANNCIAKVVGSSNQQIGIKDNRYTTTSELQTWLSTHNTIVYYVLAIPTNTQITDTTLITQLDNLQKAISYDSQTNISQTNEDKPFIITAEMFLSLKSIFD